MIFQRLMGYWQHWNHNSGLLTHFSEQLLTTEQDVNASVVQER